MVGFLSLWTRRTLGTARGGVVGLDGDLARPSGVLLKKDSGPRDEP